MREVGKAAGVRWQGMTEAEKEKYEELSTESKAEYARLKKLTPKERSGGAEDPDAQVQRNPSWKPELLTLEPENPAVGRETLIGPQYVAFMGQVGQRLQILTCIKPCMKTSVPWITLN